MSEVKYSGSVKEGTTISYGSGYGYSQQISAQQYASLLNHFNGQIVNIGTSRTNPPSGSVGEWLMQNVTRTAMASYVGPILIEEGYAEKVGGAFIRFFNNSQNKNLTDEKAKIEEPQIQKEFHKVSGNVINNEGSPTGKNLWFFICNDLGPGRSRQQGIEKVEDIFQCFQEWTFPVKMFNFLQNKEYTKCAIMTSYYGLCINGMQGRQYNPRYDCPPPWEQHWATLRSQTVDDIEKTIGWKKIEEIIYFDCQKTPGSYQSGLNEINAIIKIAKEKYYLNSFVQIKRINCSFEDNPENLYNILKSNNTFEPIDLNKISTGISTNRTVQEPSRNLPSEILKFDDDFRLNAIPFIEWVVQNYGKDFHENLKNYSWRQGDLKEGIEIRRKIRDCFEKCRKGDINQKKAVADFIVTGWGGIKPLETIEVEQIFKNCEAMHCAVHNRLKGALNERIDPNIFLYGVNSSIIDRIASASKIYYFSDFYSWTIYDGRTAAAMHYYLEEFKKQFNTTIGTEFPCVASRSDPNLPNKIPPRDYIFTSWILRMIAEELERTNPLPKNNEEFYIDPDKEKRWYLYHVEMALFMIGEDKR